MANGLHEYERWLTETIDAYMLIRDQKIVLKFNKPYKEIDLSGCYTIEGVFEAAKSLRGYLESWVPTEKHQFLPETYLLQRFCSLLNPYRKFSMDSYDLAKKIDDAWGGFDSKTRKWRVE